MSDTVRHQVFISSTYMDLASERQKVSQVLMQMDCIPAGMELFPAADQEQFEFIKTVINDCDYYVVIVGARYGTLTEEGISFTEKEYDYALERKIPVCAFLHEHPDDLPVKNAELDPAIRERLNAFRAKLRTGRLIASWSNGDELAAKVMVSLRKTMRLHPRPGWIRGDTIVETETLRDLAIANKENAHLRGQLDALAMKVDENPKPSILEFPSLEIDFTVGKQGETSSLKIFPQDILMALGSSMIVPIADRRLCNLLEVLIRKESGVDASVDVLFSDFLKVLTVFAAYGIISIKEVDDEFVDRKIALTPHGIEVLGELAVNWEAKQIRAQMAASELAKKLGLSK